MQQQPTLDDFLLKTKGGKAPSSRRVVGLFDAFGTSVAGWKSKDVSVHCYTHLPANTAGCVCLERASEFPVVATTGAGSDDALFELVKGAAFVLAFPPCKHVCISGARWWKRKRKADPEFQTKEVERITALFRLLKRARTPFAMFLPHTPLLETIDQHRPVVVSPHEFGGYLNTNDHNPVNPDIPARDAYKKRTSLFLGNRAVLPLPRPVAPKSEAIKTKSGFKNVSPLFKSRKSSVLRSVPPRGLCTAIALANSGFVHCRID